MSKKAYWLICLALPILWPVLMFGALELGFSTPILTFLGFGVMLSAAGYLAFVVASFFYLRKKEWTTWRNVIRFSPLIAAMFQFFSAVQFKWMSPSPGMESVIPHVLGVWGGLAIYVVIVGYVYLAACRLVFRYALHESL
ncbi:hypothetical protein ACJJH9_15670 [Microbulbifer sp. DLAB2-AF]|uniref:hypothetical protein n=1 Tax=Microbulbifer sp. DLAB2-AF TaxID=3243395 RepID=UPI0040396648